MSYGVEISEAGQSDLREIFQYITGKLRSGINARGQLQRIETEINSLSEIPERYPRYDVEPWFSRGVRMLSVDNYCIFYTVDKEMKMVTVIRVLYGGRNMQSALIESE